MVRQRILKPNRKWTASDHNQLIALLANGASLSMAAKKLKRSEVAVRVQATKLGLSASSDLKQRAARTEARRGG